MISPPRWTEEELKKDAAIAEARFRENRLAPSKAWIEQCQKAQKKFESLFTELGDLGEQNLKDMVRVRSAYKQNLSEVLRYLAGPPISDDDLKVLADVDSIASGVLARDEQKATKVFNVIEKVIDPFRFPWVLEHRNPTPEEKKAALLASSVLLAAQRIATDRRSEGKSDQEALVKKYLASLGFTEVAPESITTIVNGPQQKEFCGECQLGERKADVVVRLYNTALMAIECKVSNSATNSVKRINNDAAAKAEYWLKTFGTLQVVPTAALAGVFKVKNLVQAQNRGLTLFWTHDLEKLGQFITSTAP